MSYIRVTTSVRKRKGDKRFEKMSNTYAYGDMNGYVCISNGWKRKQDMFVQDLGKKKGMEAWKALNIADRNGDTVWLTHAEMRSMCRNYLSKLKK